MGGMVYALSLSALRRVSGLVARGRAPGFRTGAGGQSEIGLRVARVFSLLTKTPIDEEALVIRIVLHEIPHTKMKFP